MSTDYDENPDRLHNVSRVKSKKKNDSNTSINPRRKDCHNAKHKMEKEMFI